MTYAAELCGLWIFPLWNFDPLQFSPQKIILIIIIIIIIIIISSFIIEVVIRNFHIHIIMVHCYLYYKHKFNSLLTVHGILCYYTVYQKTRHTIVTIILSNFNRFSKIFTVEKSVKFATK